MEKGFVLHTCTLFVLRVVGTVAMAFGVFSLAESIIVVGL